jgi:hypothetical protein
MRENRTGKGKSLKHLSTHEIEALCSKRIELIEQLEVGLLSKEDFIMENYQMMQPFQRVSYEIRSLEEGVIKYHYFNTMAKKLMIEADAIEFKAPDQCSRLRSEAFEYYVKKDKITLNMLEFMGYKGVEAYFIHMQSRSLEGYIYEIKFNHHEKVVLHSKDRKILYKLKAANCFIEERQESIIQDYVNTKIY